MRGLALVVTVLAASLAIAQKAEKKISEEKKQAPRLAEAYIDNAESPTYVKVDGIWEPDNPTKQNELVPTVVQITCYRHGGKEFVGSDPFCLAATATPIAGTISVDTNWFKVVEWSQVEILLVDDSPECIISQTTFDLTSKTVTGLDIRKPNAKGLQNSCRLLPDRQTYYLRDKVDYELNHHPVTEEKKQ